MPTKYSSIPTHNDDGIKTTTTSTSASTTPNSTKYSTISIAAVILLVISTPFLLATTNNTTTNASDKQQTLNLKASNALADDPSLFDDKDRFVFKDFDSRPPHSNFLPGVAGVYGKPVWSFYVNRGQAITAFGTATKDFPLLEFNPANKAYALTPTTGFRTFLNVSGSPGLLEPFSPLTGGSRTMYVGSNEVEVEEVDAANGIKTNVNYFTLPGEDFGALVRRCTIKNTAPTSRTFQVLDGLSRLEPAGGPLDGQMKNMGRTLEGWMDVYFPPSDPSGTMPFYKLSTQPSDTAAVNVQVEGHYALFFEEAKDAGARSELLPVVYDADLVFGTDTSGMKPRGMEGRAVEDILKEKQSGAAKTSAAFGAATKKLKPGESFTITSYYGKAPHIDRLPGYASTVTGPSYTSSKFAEARALIDSLTASVNTTTSSGLFNGHVKQMFLDNALRGGVPLILGDVSPPRPLRPDLDEDPALKVYHTFSRIHGDLERDYNAFSIDPTYYSQGPGNYRDVAQNRRQDVVFTPRMGAFDVKQFLSFIQADGYEPLTVEANVFTLDGADAHEVAEWAVGKGDGFKGPRDALEAIFKGGSLRPGQLFQLMEDQEIRLHPSVSKEEFINEFVSRSEVAYKATFGDGFWADHWDYYLDLIESYLSVYPEREEALMYDNSLPYYYAPATCQPRSKKYTLVPKGDGTSKHVQQLNAMSWDAEKTARQNAFLDGDQPWLDPDVNNQHTEGGEVFTSSPIAKLTLLASLKFATRDPYGMGIEYEGGKPGWNDAMNGLVGMVGSGMPETYELQLLLRYIEGCVERYGRGVEVPVELKDMIDEVMAALDALEAGGEEEEGLDVNRLDVKIDKKVPQDLFEYWDAAASAREKYRDAVKFTFSGETVTYGPDELASILKRFLVHTELGMDRALRVGSRGDGDDGSTGVAPSYFSYDVTEYEETGESDAKGQLYVKAKAFEVGTFPLFLEGPVRMMKTIPKDSYDEQISVYNNVKASGLYDEPQNAFTVSASLVGQSIDMGRMMAFSPGWLENQSIWTHMSYKFYLQLLRGKLYDVFFSELTGGGMLPFQDPLVYGRSLMECSSFVASSAFPDANQHGRGFLARLSGSTAEFLSIWSLMFIGPRPFVVDEMSHELKMQLQPALPEWVFDPEGKVSFKLFGHIDVTYHNKGGEALKGTSPKRYEVEFKWHDGKDVVEEEFLPEYIADQARRLDVKSIDAFF